MPLITQLTCTVLLICVFTVALGVLVQVKRDGKHDEKTYVGSITEFALFTSFQCIVLLIAIGINVLCLGG